MDELEKINNTVVQGLQTSTKEVYRAGLKFFHEYCNSQGINKMDRAPASPTIIEGFATLLCSLYAAATINNYMAGVQAWHHIHNLRWDTEEKRLHMIIRAAAKLALISARRSKQPLFQKDMLEFVCSKLSNTDSCDIAIKVALTTTFWGAAHLREILLNNLWEFDPKKHLKHPTFV